ncbi:hypothetical protein VNO77_23268 [Canavalia gladiata]|uniref:Uncharacterized protein n=1 Tax=Canavalia gladiata TaxID=3824 RepID=A0AAN9L6M8_CANGL
MIRREGACAPSDPKGHAADKIQKRTNDDMAKNCVREREREREGIDGHVRHLGCEFLNSEAFSLQLDATTQTELTQL